MAVVLAGISDIFSFFSDIGFVIKIMALAYIIFWLYLTFRDSQMLFGLGAIIASYFMLTSAIPLIFIVIIFIVFVVMGNQLQMLLMFGVFPVTRFLGIELDPQYIEQKEMQQLQAAEQKLQAGQAISMEEEQLLQHHQDKAMAADPSMQMNQMQMRRRAGG